MCKVLRRATQKERLCIMYKEILELKKYCNEIGVICRYEKLFDGFAIRFNNGGDVVQHSGSYGNRIGCVEFAIGNYEDYKAISLEKAKTLIRVWKDKLNEGSYVQDNKTM